jgi:N-acetylglucosamine-6-phosphate deacetylase
MKMILRNGKLITPLKIIHKGGIMIENGKIVSIFKDEDDFNHYRADRVIDVGGYFISPGFIDIHTHGAGGYDFMDGDIKSIREACKTHMKYGTTSIVPTTLTSTMEELLNTLDNFKQAKDEIKNGPNILGLHLEGPYFSMEQRGAQDPRYIKNPEKKEYLKILNYSNDIIRWTVAPELDGALEMGNMLRERGILGSIGHTNAIYKEVLAAYENGFTHITHLYSGMSMVRRINAFRYSGVVESAYLIDEMTVEIIADGKHLPASLLKLIYKIKGADKICLITDSMRAAGMPEGEYILGGLKDGQKVIVEDGVAKLMDRSAFAGSVATSNRLVKTMVSLADIPLHEAVKMVTLTPARVMRIDDKKGCLAIGRDADIVVFDENINPLMVIVGGDIRINNI